jgi:histidinol-phosphate aminotransferase
VDSETQPEYGACSAIDMTGFSFPARTSAYSVQWQARPDTRSILNLKSCELQHPAMNQLIAEAVAGLSFRDVSQYPYQRDLISGFAEDNDVGADQVLITPGSSSAIALVVDALAVPAGGLVLQEPAFDRWLHHAAIRRVPVTRCEGVVGVPPTVVTRTFSDAMLAADPSVAVITNPGNPTGVALSLGQIEDLGKVAAERGHCLIVDECYGAFSRISHVPLLHSLPNLIILRSLSKSWALAGARLAIMFGSVGVVDYLRRFGADDAVSAPAVALARALSRQTEALQAIWADVTAIREEFTVVILGDRPRWTALPSATNFVTFCTGTPGEGRRIEDGLAQRRIRIRGLDDVAGMSGCLRFSLAGREQMKHVVEQLRTLE